MWTAKKRAEMARARERGSRKSAGVVLVVTLMSLLGSTVAKADEHIYQRALKSVALIVNVLDEHRAALGTGVLVDAGNGYMVTAAHVVAGSEQVAVFPPAYGRDGQVITDRNYYGRNAQRLGIPARVVAIDTSRDVAVLQLQRVPSELKPMPLAASSAVPGQQIFAVGNSGESDDGLWCYRQGAVRQVCRKTVRYSENQVVKARVIETTSLSNHGDSGGPIINARGELVGITSGGPEQIGVDYCIDISEVRMVLQSVSRSEQSEPQDEAPAISARINGLKRTDGVSRNGQSGMDMRVSMNVDGAKGHTLAVVVAVCDASGRPVRDAQGNPVVLVKKITPGYPQTTYGYDDLAIFVPFNLLDATLNGHTQFVLAVGVWDVERQTWVTAKPTMVRASYEPQTQTAPVGDDLYQYN